MFRLLERRQPRHVEVCIRISHPGVGWNGVIRGLERWRPLPPMMARRSSSAADIQLDDIICKELLLPKDDGTYEVV